MNQKKTGWLRYFANERLDPDGENQKMAFEYAEKHHVDINDDEKMRKLVTKVGDKADELLHKLKTEPESSNTSKIRSKYENQVRLYNGFKAIIFNRIQDSLDEWNKEDN